MKNIRTLITLIVAVFVFLVVAFATETETRDVSFETELATDLKAMGLFSGVSDTDFDLERVPTRLEVLVMLIRVLGEEKTALDGEWTHPFTDVPLWADKYVGYAYENGLTMGISATEFGTDNASAVTYLTFMLRALGYSDAEGDFKWDAPHSLARGLGILPSIVDTENFWRADIVTVSYAALSVNLKDSTVMLSEKLIEKGAFTAETYGANYVAGKLTDKENEGKTVLTSEQIFNQCSPAVVCINTYDENGELYWNGSGFFIDESGIGITTYYVVEGASRVEVVIPATGAKYDVTGIYDFSGRYDWVVFKVDGSGFATLPYNNMPVKGASAVYAIGSPEGLENTVSEGIVSNARQVMYGDFAYIQVTTPISDGSFGGPLVNSFGEVIGIIHDYDYDGQNINFALPITALAAADTTTATPYAEFDWNSVWYYTETDEVTLKAGEAVEFFYDYDCSSNDYEWPDIKVTSTDNSVATAIMTSDYGTLRITGNKAGTAEIVFSDNLSKDTHTVSVTVEENPEITAPAVIYTPTMDEVKLYNGAHKNVTVDIVEYGITETPDGTLAAEYTVKCSNSNIKVEHEFEEFDEESEHAGKNIPVLTLTVTGKNDATGEITVSNDKTGDTLVIPVTVGNRYESAYNEFVEAIVSSEEDIVYYEDKEKPENSYYAYETAAAEGEGGIYYYPTSGDIIFAIHSVQEQGTLDFEFIWTKDRVTKYSFVLNIMGISIVCAGDIEKPETFGTEADVANFKHDTLECPEMLKEDMSQTFTSLIVTYVYVFDVSLIPEINPGMDMSDFGFIALADNFPDLIG